MKNINSLQKELALVKKLIKDEIIEEKTISDLYKYIFKWKSVDLTFHKISNKLDNGEIINQRKIALKKINAINLIALTLQNKDFYLKSIFLLNNKKRNKYKKKPVGPINKEPSFFKILKTNFN